MPGIILGTKKTNKKYQQLVTPAYTVLQQNILDKVRILENEKKATKRIISSFWSQ
jgi:hypothetical protein